MAEKQTSILGKDGKETKTLEKKKKKKKPKPGAKLK